VGEFLVFSSLIMINLALRTYSINANTVIDEGHAASVQYVGLIGQRYNYSYIYAQICTNIIVFKIVF
jgi:hypothetical protein